MQRYLLNCTYYKVSAHKKIKKMNKFILNIGLNVGSIEPKTQLDSTMFHVKQLLPKCTITVRDNLGGSWGNERVVVVKGEVSLSLYNFEWLLKDLCWRLRQNAISFNHSDDKGLIFDPEYKGEQYKYDENFFLTK